MPAPANSNPTSITPTSVGAGPAAKETPCTSPAAAQGEVPSAATASNVWLERGFFAALLLACAIALSPNTVDPDLWGHVQYAEDSLAEGTLHREATHTYTAIGYPWVNHENLSEFSLALANRYFGPHGILIGKCLIGLFVVCLMIRIARRRGVSTPVLCGSMLMVATALTAFWAARPQIASFLMLALLLAALERAFADWSTSFRTRGCWLWSAPPILAIWANAHGGFAAGWCILAAYLGLRGLEAIYHRRAAAWKTLLEFTAVLFFSALATLATPYGTELIVWMSGTLTSLPPEISEWGAPNPQDPFFFPLVLMLSVGTAAIVFTEKRRDWPQIIILALLTWQSVMHARHMAILAILVGFWLPEHIQSMITRFRRGTEQERVELPAGSPLRIAIGCGLVFALLLLCVRLGTRLWDFPVEKDEYPVTAIQYMEDHHLHGSLVVSFNWAQYALSAMAGEVQVGFDGRFNTCYPQEVIDMHFDFLLGDLDVPRHRGQNSGPIDPQKALEFGQPDLLLVDRRYSTPQRVLSERTDFVLLYQDKLAQVWGRTTKFGNPLSSQYVPLAAREIGNREQLGTATWPAFPVRRTEGIAGARSSHTQPEQNVAGEDRS
jgi:hypothetical protein